MLSVDTLPDNEKHFLTSKDLRNLQERWKKGNINWLFMVHTVSYLQKQLVVLLTVQHGD